jgi:hypothetical protein
MRIFFREMTTYNERYVRRGVFPARMYYFENGEKFLDFMNIRCIARNSA